jgi:peptidoglycan hydrolase-like protein with peptidoglycan-binding domain
VLSKVTQNGVVVQTVATVLSLDPLTKTVTSNTTDSLAVAKVQLVLAHEGYIQKEDISGNYLSKTVSAMKAFQAAHQLEVTGSAGPQTRTLINTLLSTKISNPLSCPWSCGYIQ